MAEPRSNINSTLAQRRIQRDTDQMMEESASRMTEVLSTSIEVCQKNMSLCSSMFHYWGEMYQLAQMPMERMVDHTQRLTEQMRRAS